MLPPAGVNLLSDLAGLGLIASASVLVGDPLLASLGNYGGPTKTMPPLFGSPVIDAATNGPATDQRGLARPQGANYDIGAVVFLPAVVTTASDEDNVVPGTGLSLREAIENPFASTINFDSAVFNGEPFDTIILANGQLSIMRSLIIDASAITGGVTVSGNNASRVFEIFPDKTVSLDSLTIINGLAFTAGGINNRGTLMLNHVDVTGNFGGGWAAASKSNPAVSR